jgi:hypothetical protein
MARGAVGCPVRAEALLSPIGPAVPVGSPGTVVELSPGGLAVEFSRWVAPSDQLAVAFALPDGPDPARIVAITVAREATAAADGWRIDLAFEQLHPADAERIATFLRRRERAGAW